MYRVKLCSLTIDECDLFAAHGWDLFLKLLDQAGCAGVV